MADAQPTASATFRPAPPNPSLPPDPDAIHVRPLSPKDAAACRDFGDHLLPDDLRLRFAGPIRVEDALRLLRLAIDQSRETVLAAFDEDDAMVGIGRMVPVSATDAEITLLVRSDLKGRGIGARLLKALIDHGRAAGHRSLRADVLYENLRMRRLAAAFGFRFRQQAGSMIEMRLSLDPETPAAPAIAPTRQSCLFPW